MRFGEMLDAGVFPVALEITPPKTAREAILLRRARVLGARPDVVNVIQRADRWSSLDASLLLRRHGLEPVWHVVNRGRTRREIATDAARARAGGVELALCLRGDHAAADGPETPKIREVVGMLREALPGGWVGVAANQYGPRDRVLRNLRAKLAAGARFVQTNPVFDPGPLVSLADAVKSRNPDVMVVPMVMPLVDAATAERIARRLAVALPAGLVEGLRRGGADAGWDAFGATLATLRESPLIDGVAIMTPSMDVEPALGVRIAAALPDRS